MKIAYTLTLITGILVSSVSLFAEETTTASEKEALVIQAPETYVTGKEFEVTIEVNSVNPVPQTLALTFNYTKTDGSFGGILHFIPETKQVDGPGKYTFKVAVKKTKPNLENAILNAYLSPDGTWKGRTEVAQVSIKMVAAQPNG